jgi:hypothetical protein
VIEVLETVRQNQRRVILFYGNTQAGQFRLKKHDGIGRIGRSTGLIKVPLLLEPGKIGETALLDHCVIRIDSPCYEHSRIMLSWSASIRFWLRHDTSTKSTAITDEDFRVEVRFG